MNNHGSQEKRLLLGLISIVSILVPLVVAFLIFMPKGNTEENSWIHYLPPLHALFNSGTAVCLIMGLIFVKQKKVIAHRNIMLTALGLSVIFLVSYIIYHSQAPSTKFGDLNGDGTLDPAELEQVSFWRPVYLVVLLSHILLAVIAVPLVLLAVYFGLSNKVEKHKKVVRWGFPVWLYVAVTGVIVYFMVQPYY